MGAPAGTGSMGKQSSQGIPPLLSCWASGSGWVPPPYLLLCWWSLLHVPSSHWALVTLISPPVASDQVIQHLWLVPWTPPTLLKGVPMINYFPLKYWSATLFSAVDLDWLSFKSILSTEADSIKFRKDLRLMGQDLYEPYKHLLQQGCEVIKT